MTRALLAKHGPAAAPGAIVVALLIVWAAKDGGYDSATWYWGALLLLALLAGVLAARRRLRISRAGAIALGAFAAYVAWSYLSIAWAQSPGDALEGSNRALLYLVLFALMVALPWTLEAALGALSVFAFGVGVIAIVLVFRLASGDHVSTLLIDGRLYAPTGYFNSSVALFTLDALVAIGLAARRSLPGALRGGFVAIAAAGLQLAVVGQSRGWLFTLPLVVLCAVAVVQERLRFVAAATLPVLATLIALHRLLAVFRSDPSKLDSAARHAGHTALLLLAAVFAVATLLAWAETLRRPRPLSTRARRALGGVICALVLLGGGAGAVAATHGDPFGFIKRQWNGFSHPPGAGSTGTHFATVGSGRYDFWRVSLHALAAHPLGGLGQDNFADYYLTHRRTDEEAKWTHSFEMRLLAHTGLVGFALFVGFLAAALAAVAIALRRSLAPARPVIGLALLPLVVWLVHGSVDWFWELPALTGPAVGFLGMAVALGRPLAPVPAQAPDRAPVPAERTPATRPRAALTWAIGAATLLAATVALGFPYLAVRKVSAASDVRSSAPVSALSDLADAADLNPLSAEAPRLAGAIALETGRLIEAEHRFREAISRERGGWFAWFGDGLAASALGDSARAYADYKVAARLNSKQPAVVLALARVNTIHPLTPQDALSRLVLAH